MAGPSEIVTDVWNNAQTLASTYKADATAALNNAINAAGSTAPSTSPASLSFTPAVIEPPVDIPTTAQAAGWTQFREIWAETIEDLSLRFRDFILEYFPDETDYINQAQTWLSNTIASGGTGLAPTIEDQIWQRERARVLRDADRADADVLVSWAGRGYPLPTGAAVFATIIAGQDRRDKIAESSSKVAIAQAELEQKNTQFAVENAIKLWTGAMAAAGDYIKAIATGPGAAGQVIPSITDSQAKLISAANTYYESRIKVEELRLKASLPNSQWYQEANLKNADLKMDYIKAKVQAAAEAARIAGQMAAAALNSLHASAAISGSDSTNYNYSGEI